MTSACVKVREFVVGPRNLANASIAVETIDTLDGSHNLLSTSVYSLTLFLALLFRTKIIDKVVGVY